MTILIFDNYKTSPCTLRQYRVSRNFRWNKDIFITKPDKGNGVVILDRELYNNAIQEIISKTSKFEKLNKVSTLKDEASLRFLGKLKQKTFLTKMYMINCILLVLIPLVSVVLLKCTSFPLVIHFRLFHQ